jgi:NAD(P)H-hydrate epimerase
MIILNENQIRAWDAYTIGKGRESIDLVEQAAISVVQKLDLLLGDEDQEVMIVCGNGNNGADGLAVARLLVDLDYLVDVYVILSGEHSEEWKINYERLLQADPEHLEIHDAWQPDEIELSASGTIIDAMFGTGLKRPISGKWLEITNWINEQSNLTIAIDMPSGMYVDRPPDGEVVYADLVLTFQCQRLSFMMPESEPYFGEVIVCEIGLSDTFLLENDIRSFELRYYYLLPFLIERSRFSHKGDFGHGLLIAGSLGKGGACVLSAAAAMRSGIGLLTVHVPQRLYDVVQTAVPEAMVIMDQHQDYFTGAELFPKVSAIGIGPGLGTSKASREGFIKLLESKKIPPLVIDADGLNILSMNPAWLDKLPEGTILTPHPGEFDRLFGDQDDHYMRYRTACAEAQKRKINIVLKGGVTIICQFNGVSFFNTRGNPGMATAGSGDVLTGILLGLLSQGYSPEYAALLGVYIHATAGDLAAEDIGYEALIASEIIEYLGVAFEELKSEEMDLDETEGEND